MNKPNDLLQIDETTQAAWNGGARWYKRQSEEADGEVEKFSLIVYRLIGDYNYQWSYLHDPWWQNCPEIEPAADWGRLVKPPQPLTNDEKAVKIFNMIVDNGYALDESYFLPRIKGIIEA